MLEKLREAMYDPKIVKIIGTTIGAILGAVVTGLVVKAVTSPTEDMMGADLFNQTIQVE